MNIEGLTPCDDIPGECECQLMVDEDTWHFVRRCANCKGVSRSLHCPHDGIQTQCVLCGVRHAQAKSLTTVEDAELEDKTMEVGS
jgi:hypothetical protein